MEKQRLDKVLSNGGCGSRSEIKEFLKKGLIKINGQVIKDGGIHINPHEDLIEVNGAKFTYRKHIYIMLNKPQGVLSATEDSKYQTVLDLIDQSYSHYDLFPVGRLDIDTEGLIFLTNDGKLAHRIITPKNHIPKKYFVKVCGKITDEDIAIFREGVILEDNYKTLPSELEVVSSDEQSEALLTIYEGKFHQIKRMFEALGKKVIYLKRLSIGDLILDESLDLGQFRELTDLEIENLNKL